MANFYVRSTDGSDSDNGSTWALAKATIAGAFAAASAGDTIYVSDNHAETDTVSKTLTSPGTAASPVQVICVDDSAEPPTARATTATVSVTSTNNAISFDGFAYYYGISFVTTSGNSASISSSATSPKALIWDTCVFDLGTGNANISFNGTVGSANHDDQLCRLVNCTIRFDNTAASISCAARVLFEDLVIDAAGSEPATLFASVNAIGCEVEVLGSDLSKCAGSSALVSVAGAAARYFLFRNCKLGSGVAMKTGTNPGQGGTVVDVINCDSGDTNYRDYHADYAGEWLTETTIKRTGGASDGTTGRSFKFVSSANSKWYSPLNGPWMTFWNETVGGVTVAAEVVTDNVTLTDLEAWIEVEHLGTSGFPQSLLESDRIADPIFGTPANQSSSSETWTTTGLSTPVKQTLSKSVTVAEKGPIRARVVLAKVSTTMYVDPLVLASSARQWMGAEYVNEAPQAGGGGDPFPSAGLQSIESGVCA